MSRAPRAILAAILAAACSLAASGAAAGEELRLTPDRPLAFIDADGRAVLSSDFAGKWLLVYFGYTHCADLCPTGLTAMVTALDEIGPAASHVQPLFVTVDPERDKGPLLRTFTRSFDDRLVGLGGSVEQIRAAAAALGVNFEKVVQEGGGYSIDHSSTYALVDPARSRALVLRLAEPHMIAARLIEELIKAGVPLGDVNNVGAYR
ncbi:MAG: SCO family protein [Hyphomicrobiaceae bacterium]|nr:SCO family protein [Hyphomicrobiaceae bacterium]